MGASNTGDDVVVGEKNTGQDATTFFLDPTPIGNLPLNVLRLETNPFKAGG